MLDREHFKSNKSSLRIANSEPGISGRDLQVQPKVCDHNLVIPDQEQLIVFQFPLVQGHGPFHWQPARSEGARLFASGMWPMFASHSADRFQGGEALMSAL